MAAHSEFPEYAHGGIRGEKRKKGFARPDEWKQEDIKDREKKRKEEEEEEEGKRGEKKGDSVV